MSPSDSTLGDPQQIIADLERRLAERTAERDEAEAQKAAMAEVLGVINSSPGDLAPVFDAMLEKAMRLCEASFGIMFAVEGETLRVVADSAVPQRLREFLTLNPPELGPRISRGETTVHVADLTAEKVNPARRALADLGDARTTVWVALRGKDALLGVIAMYRREVRPFTDKQIALLHNFAAQAVIAMENARLITETREALEQQTATAEVLQVINSSPGDLGPVFDKILENAHKLCGAAQGTLTVREGDQFRTVAAQGLPESLTALLRQPFSPVPGGGVDRLMRGERVVHIPDVRTQVGDGVDNPIRSASIKAGIRTLLFVPLRKGGVLLGHITAHREEVRPFSDREIALLENFAAQAVIAMDNASLITETREALEQQTATAEVLGVINSSPGELVPVFDAMLEKATRLCDADFGILWNFEGELAKAGALHRVPEAYATMVRAPFRPSPESGPARMMRGESTFVVPDLLAFPPYQAGDALVRAIVDLAGARSVMITPLRKDGATLGAITIYRQEIHPFTDRQIALLENFAAQAVIAIENVRLITETREALEQQTATAEVLGVINASPGDLAPVFDAILEKSIRLCEAVFGQVFAFDGEQFELVAVTGPTEFAAAVRRWPAFRAPPGSAIERVATTKEVAHIEDLRTVRAYIEGHPFVVASVELGGYRTVLSVPMLKDDQLIGAININRQVVRPFTEKQIALLQNFAAQAVIAMENARLITETREALEKQTASAEVLGVINSSPGNLAPVFEAMLDKALWLCDAAFGWFWTYEGDRFQVTALRGAPPALVEFLRQPVHGFHAGTGVGRLLQGERVTIHSDMAEEEAYKAGDPLRCALVDLGGARSAVTMALRRDERSLDAFTVYRQEVRLFTDKQIALLQNFAAQAVIAMENARLITETREALEQQTATAEVLGVINSSPGDLAPVFDAMLEKATRLCEAAAGTFWVGDGEQWHPVAIRGMPEQFVQSAVAYRPSPISPVGQIESGEKLVHLADLAAAEVYRAGDALVRAAVDQHGIRTLLSVPLRKEDRLLGVFSVYRREVRPFTDKQAALVQNFAAQAVIAMENARLITETREALEQQTATAEVLGVINSSPGDLAPVFDAMLEKALHLCEAAFGSLMTYDGTNFHPAALRRVPSGYAEFLRQPQHPTAGSALTRVVEERTVVQIADGTMTEGYRERRPLAVAGVELGGIRTLIVVPLLRDETLLGVFHLYRQEVRPFTDKQIALLQNFAAQAVIAMENARLIAETREALEQQIATTEVLRVINSSPGDLTPVFDAILEKAHALCGAATGSLQLYDGEFLRAVATRGLPDEFANILRQPRRSSFHAALDAFLRGEAWVQITDIADPALTGGDKTLGAAHESAGVRTLLRVALRKDDKLLGLIVAGRREVRPFSQQEISLLQSFAEQAVIAMDNARLLDELRQRTDEVGELNRGLEARVAEQVDELGRVGRLKRFLAPQLAELIVSRGDENILESHRREIVVVFCDLRGYTGFTETAEPEEVLDFLREYHGALGPLVSQFEGTLDQFSGDGIMVFFNDPVPIPDPAERAVKMAVAMREEAGKLIGSWRRRGRELGFGAGIAQGYATLGQIGFADRSGYTAIGTVCNLAARLCAEAKDGQILVAQRVAFAVEGTTKLEEIGALTLKGLTQPVVAFNVPLTDAQPALRVIEGGPQEV